MTDADFTSYLSAFMPQSSMTSARAAVATQYPSSDYPNPSARFGAIIRDVAFVCNTRQLFDSYHAEIPTYMVQYSAYKNRSAAVHGSDLLATFWNADINFIQWVTSILAPFGKKPFIGILYYLSQVFGARKHFACQYQSHLVAHAINGDPNSIGSSPCTALADVNWATATTTTQGIATYVSDVIEARPTGPRSKLYPTQAFDIIYDTFTPNTVCDFWKGIAEMADPSSQQEDGTGGLHVQNPDAGRSRPDL